MIADCSGPRPSHRLVFWLVVGAALLPGPLAGQGPAGGLGGEVVGSDGRGIQGVQVRINGADRQAFTNAAGQFQFSRAPVGRQVVELRRIGYRAVTRTVSISQGGTAQLTVTMEIAPAQLGEIVVTGASRGPEPTIDAPAAVSTIDPAVSAQLAPTGQAPLAVGRLPGLDLTQNGINDFNLTVRGFNTTTSRRVLVLQDGRDLSYAFLGAQEWPALSTSLEDWGHVELVRGPGSALYGPNAFSGLLDITTPTTRETLGSRVTAAAGELRTRRVDLRHGGMLAEDRLGYRLSLGYGQSDTWSRSRTNLGDLESEYASAVDTSKYPVHDPFPGFELLPLKGQTKQGPFGVPGPVTGKRDDLVNYFGTARVDYYGRSGSLATLEGGDARTENEVYVTSVGRFQVGAADRPWVRAAYVTPGLHLSAWYSGRISRDQVSLAAGTPIHEISNFLHVEAQANRDILRGKARVVVGASARRTYVNSDGTLLSPEDDGRSDGYYSGYAQLEYTSIPRLRLIAASRLDASDLYDTQFSPKLAVVYSPDEENSFRLTFNRAFQTPSVTERFLSVPAGVPGDFTALEDALRVSPLGPALAQVPESTLFTVSSAVPVLGLGNKDLNVERMVNWEAGYKRRLGTRGFATVDLFVARLRDFVTDLLPGVNPAFGAWTAPSEVPAEFRPAIEQAVRDALTAGGSPEAAVGLTRLPDGSTAIVFSNGNAGRATEYGVEFSVAAAIGSRFLAGANYSYAGFDLDSSTTAIGQEVLPDAPSHKGNVFLSYFGPEGLELRGDARFASAYDWAQGIFAGRVPPSAIVDLTASYLWGRRFRAQVLATNLFDWEAYQIYGGSALGRRTLVRLTTFF
jgi:outer membrane receptor for ferrienterochelin and colicins